MAMRIGDIDWGKKPVTPQLFLCRPNKVIISKMNEAYDILYNPKLGALNELNFTLPVFIDKRHEMERNENADKMRGRYLIKLVLGKHQEYFMVTQVEKKGEESGEEFSITALSIGFELNDKIIRDYKAVSKTATELLNEILVDSIWNIGYIDSEFDLKKRGMEVSSNTVLEVVFEVAKTFNALVVWDTLNRKVEFRKPDLVGLEKGLKIKYGKYLESLNQEDNAEEIITRLKMYGKEDISIREINPVGTTYIEDFRYFMYPYREEEYFDKFDIVANSALSNWNFTSGKWGVENKTINGNSYTFLKLLVNESVRHPIINTEYMDATDCNLKGTFVAYNGDDDMIGFVFRYQDAKNYYYFGYSGGGVGWGLTQHARIYKVVNGVETLLSSNDFPKWVLNTEYNIKLEVVRNTFKVYVNGVLAVTAQDTTFKSGTFGYFGYSQIFGVTNMSVEVKGFNVIDHSDYMSDELCHAILLYNKLQEENKGAFEALVTKRTGAYAIHDAKSSEKNALDVQLKILLDERDVLNTRIAKMEDEVDNADNLGNDTVLLKSNLDSLKNELMAKLIEIEAKKLQVSTKEAEVSVAKADLQGVLDEINVLKELLSIESNFTQELIVERNQYIIEKEWQDSNIDNAKDLLAEGMKVFEEVRQQKITLKVDLVNFLSMITEQINWDKLGLGDIIVIEHERLDVAFKAKITEIEYNFEDNTINVTISNVKDLYSNKDKFLDMLYKGYGSSTQISIDKWKWDLSMENKGSINQIINNFWDANKQAIIGAKNQVVEFSDRGLIIRDPNDPMTYLVGLNGMIAITNDGGNTWKHAITGTGIVGERLYGKVIMGVNLAIEDEHGIVKWQGSLGEIFDRNGKLVMKMGLVDEEPDTFGLWSFNDITRVRMDDRTGLAVERKNNDLITYPNGWEKVMWTDVDGTLFTHDLIAENIKIVNNVGEVILDAENNYLDIGSFENIVMDKKFTTLEKVQIITELYKIEAGYKRMLEQAAKYKTSDRDAVFDTSAQFFSKTPSNIDLYSTTPLTNAYNALLTYMEQFIKIIKKDPLTIDINDPLTEMTSEIPDRAEFILKFKNYYDAEKDLRNKIEDAQFYSGLNMGQFYNNVVIGQYGFIALRNDGKYRAWLNATNGLALQKWENNRWTNKVYASIGNSVYEDGTLIAEDLVAKRLRIETKDGGVLLDVNSLELDFTTLNAIILDDVIMSPEKVTLSNQYRSIIKQYNELKSTINRYVTTIYSDRDSSYTGLALAKDQLVTAGNDLTNAFNALTTYMTPVFADMNKKTHIVNDLHSTRVIFYTKWEDFYKAYENGRNKLADFLEKSSLQLGRNYNNTVIDALNGIVVTRGNMMNRTTLNATEGIKIEQNMGSASSPAWVKRFYVDLSGKLFAEQLHTRELRILDGNLGDAIIFDALTGITINGKRGEQIRLNANEGIAIDVKGEQRFWVHTDGTLRARKLIIMDGDNPPVKLPDGSFISQLTVSSVRTLDNANMQDYVWVKDQFIKFVSGNGSGTDSEKMKIYLDSPNGYLNGVPVIKMGEGSGSLGSDNEVGYIIKDQDAWKFNYKAQNGNQRRLWFNRTGSEGILMESIGNMLRLTSDTSVRLQVNNNFIEITPNGITISGTRIDLN